MGEDPQGGLAGGNDDAASKARAEAEAKKAAKAEAEAKARAEADAQKAAAAATATGDVAGSLAATTHDDPPVQVTEEEYGEPPVGRPPLAQVAEEAADETNYLDLDQVEPTEQED